MLLFKYGLKAFEGFNPTTKANIRYSTLFLRRFMIDYSEFRKLRQADNSTIIFWSNEENSQLNEAKQQNLSSKGFSTLKHHCRIVKKLRPSNLAYPGYFATSGILLPRPKDLGETLIIGANWKRFHSLLFTIRKMR